ncbi:helix-turn-helix domain-containing protein [Paludibaculum fermentans]|uniref:helix-turn-helix domain-containing protein n=1 Tax=Paludibaculum fermentans TaxID=1473598 RepID=UPI003EBF952B
MPYLTAWRWPRNVRELENVIERMLVLSTGEVIGVEDLAENMRRGEPARGSILLELPPEGTSLEGVERELLLRALERSYWSQAHAARHLDISRRTLIYRMEKHDLRKDGRLN